MPRLLRVFGGRLGGIRDGARVSLRVGPPLVFFRWSLEHVDYQYGWSFMDRQVRGPFYSWTHVHWMTRTAPMLACWKTRSSTNCRSAPSVAFSLDRSESGS
jgi:hypothetical protein